jgi:hypothetical protein
MWLLDKRALQREICSPNQDFFLGLRKITKNLDRFDQSQDFS